MLKDIRLRAIVFHTQTIALQPLCRRACSDMSTRKTTETAKDDIRTTTTTKKNKEEDEKSRAVEMKRNKMN